MNSAGARRNESDLAEYVLDTFEPEEEEVAERLVELGARAVEDLLERGVAAAMDRWNGKSAAASNAESVRELD